MISLSLLILLLTISFPRLSFFQHYYLSQELQELHSIVSYLQHKSMATNTIQKLYIHPNNHSYSYEKNNHAVTHILNDNVKFGFMERVKGPPSSPKKAIEKSITFHKNIIEFYPQGTVSSGTIYLTDKNKHYLQALTCGISHISHIRTYLFTENKWRLFNC